MSKEKLIKQEDLPNTLWNTKKNCLLHPPDLINAWRHLLDTSGLYSQAMQPVPQNVIGGIDKTDLVPI